MPNYVDIAGGSSARVYNQSKRNGDFQSSIRDNRANGI